MMIPLTPKITVPISIQRINSAVSACCQGAKPGARTVRTNHGASKAATAATAVIMINTRLLTALNNRHAPVS